MLTIVDRLPRSSGFTPSRTEHRLRHIFALIGYWLERDRQRQSLAQIDNHLLADIGLTRDQQSRECVKPFWLP
jgi:uncharacterized protein YjiS (DUF1127 family)